MVGEGRIREEGGGRVKKHIQVHAAYVVGLASMGAGEEVAYKGVKLVVERSDVL